MSSTVNSEQPLVAVLEKPRPVISPIARELFKALGSNPGNPREALDRFDIDTVIGAGVEIEKIHQLIYKEMSGLRSALESIRDHVALTMTEEGATRKAHPAVTIELEPDVEIVRDVAVLAELKDVVSAEDFKKFMYEKPAPPPPQPEIVVDLRSRKRIEKYGAKALEILKRGLREVPIRKGYKIKWTPTAEALQ